MKPQCSILLVVAAAVLAQQSPDAARNARNRAAASWLDPNPSEPTGTHYRTFKSDLAKSEVSYLIYLPPDYETNASRRYPVVYFLHGYTANLRAGVMFVRPMDAAIRAGKAPAMIVVLVNGITGSYYCDSRDGKWPVDSVITKELIPHIDQTYRTMAGRETRAVEGFSMGGYGAAHLGFKHPDLFGMVSIRAGALTDSAEWGPLEGALGGRRKLMQSAPQDYFEANDLATLIRRNAEGIRGRTKIRIAVGSDDGLRPANEALHQFLTKLKIEHEFEIVPGVGHDSSKLYLMLGERACIWYQTALPPRQTRGSEEAWNEDSVTEIRCCLIWGK